MFLRIYVAYRVARCRFPKYRFLIYMFKFFLRVFQKYRSLVYRFRNTDANLKSGAARGRPLPSFAALSQLVPSHPPLDRVSRPSARTARRLPHVGGKLGSAMYGPASAKVVLALVVHARGRALRYGGLSI